MMEEQSYRIVQREEVEVLDERYFMFEASLTFIFQVGCCVSLPPMGGEEHKATSFPYPRRWCLRYLRSFSFIFFLFVMD
jgi:hypothetical protein